MIQSLRTNFLFLLVLVSFVHSSSPSDYEGAEENTPRLRRVGRVYDELARLPSSSDSDDSFIIDMSFVDDEEKRNKAPVATNVPRRLATVLAMSTLLVTVMGLIVRSSLTRQERV